MLIHMLAVNHKIQIFDKYGNSYLYGFLGGQLDQPKMHGSITL
uniref:Uncharacterized protein n=1 Tax=Nelumbo nucifera TaxID=4432 RepID=A0A822ZCZ7_NELNU|nr:TPA_asm: hypothetical protein HUJ06_015618 [Nelumbo nucifera]